jgi:hypothetical protein
MPVPFNEETGEKTHGRLQQKTPDRNWSGNHLGMFKTLLKMRRRTARLCIQHIAAKRKVSSEIGPAGKGSSHQAGLGQHRQDADDVSLEKEIVGSGSLCKDPFPVEFKDSAAVLPDHGRQSRGRKNLGRGADDQQQVATGDEAVNCLDVAYRFTEEHHIGFQGEAAVFAARYPGGLEKIRVDWLEIAALQAVQMLMVAVDLKDQPAACLLVHVVDVLGDDAVQQASCSSSARAR